MDLPKVIAETLAFPSDQRAIQFNGVWRDWGWMRSVADAIESRLVEAGVGPRDPVGLAPRNRPEYVAALLALMAAGRHAVMIYAYQSPEAMALRLRELALPAVILGEQDWTDATRAAAQECGTAGICLRPEPPFAPLEAGLGFRPDVSHLTAPEKAGIDLLTSGTTGPPKRFAIDYERMGRALIAENILKPSAEQGPALHVLPFGNIGGLYSMLPTIVSGRPIIMHEKFSLPAWLDYVREYRPAFGGVPSGGLRMILEAKVDPADLSSIKAMAGGAATLDPNVRREFERVYGIPIVQAYGATEFGGVVSNLTLAHREEYGDSKADSVGRPWAGAQFRIVDPDTGEILPTGETGRLELISPRMGPDWISTSDLGMLDEDGFLWHRGRLDGAIMRGGFKIVPEVVAEALASHPAIASAAVVGVPDNRLGEVPAAAYEVRSGVAEPTAKDLEAHLRALLPATYLPVYYRAVTVLPRTPSMKLDGRALKALFA